MASEVSPSLTHGPGETASYFSGPLIIEREMGILGWDDFLLFGQLFSWKFCLCLAERKRTLSRCTNGSCTTKKSTFSTKVKWKIG